MDDFPAGPASHGPRRPPLSVVIPVHNGGRCFERCLRGLRASTWTDYELIVVDDGSTDGSESLARAYGAHVVRHERSMGPAAARNSGAEAARAPIIFFLDADVAVHPTAIARAVARLDGDPTLAALFGSYDDDPSEPGVASRFRNLLHHYVHQQGQFIDDARPAHTFWTGCGAIRRDIFLAVGGFDPQLYRRPAIEDIELGYRLTRAGFRIALARDILATHMKRWTIAQIVRTDIFQRGLPWTLLMLRTRVAETDLNVSSGQKLSVAATGLALLAIAAAPWQPLGLLVALACLGLNCAINHRFYRFLSSRGNARFTAGAILCHQLYFICCGASVVLALVVWHMPPALLGQRKAGSPRGRLDPAASVAVPIPWHRRWSRLWQRQRG